MKKFGYFRHIDEVVSSITIIFCETITGYWYDRKKNRSRKKYCPVILNGTKDSQKRRKISIKVQNVECQISVKREKSRSIGANSTKPIRSHAKTSPRPPKAALQVPSSITKPSTFPESTEQKKKKKKRMRNEIRKWRCNSPIFVIRIRSLDLALFKIDLSEMNSFVTESLFIEPDIQIYDKNIFCRNIEL